MEHYPANPVPTDAMAKVIGYLKDIWCGAENAKKDEEADKTKS